MNIDEQHQGVTNHGYNSWAVNRLTVINIVFCYAQYDTHVYMYIEDRFPTHGGGHLNGCALESVRIYTHIRSLARQLVKRA